MNLSSDSVRATDIDKWMITGRALHAKSEGETTGDRIALGTQYNRDVSARWFVFGSADALRDEPANLSSRLSVAAGPGYHLWQRDTDFWRDRGCLASQRPPRQRRLEEHQPTRHTLSMLVPPGWPIGSPTVMA